MFGDNCEHFTSPRQSEMIWSCWSAIKNHIVCVAGQILNTTAWFSCADGTDTDVMSPSASDFPSARAPSGYVEARSPRGWLVLADSIHCLLPTSFLSACLGWLLAWDAVVEIWLPTPAVQAVMQSLGLFTKFTLNDHTTTFWNKIFQEF